MIYIVICLCTDKTEVKSHESKEYPQYTNLFYFDLHAPTLPTQDTGNVYCTVYEYGWKLKLCKQC